MRKYRRLLFRAIGKRMSHRNTELISKNERGCIMQPRRARSRRRSASASTVDGISMLACVPGARAVRMPVQRTLTTTAN